jgi:deoxyribodipyrimidine photo-lyase
VRAAETGKPVLPVFVWDDRAPWAPGGASRWWLHHSLSRLQGSLAELGLPLVLRRGAVEDVLPALAGEVGAEGVYASRSYEPSARAQEEALHRILSADGIEFRRFPGTLLVEPEEGLKRDGSPFRVFTPFYRNLLERLGPRGPLSPPERPVAPTSIPRSDRLETWALVPSRPDWAGGLRDAWVPGEAEGRRRLEEFLERAASAYGEARDRPAVPGTSRLSPYLHFGELSPREIWHTVSSAGTQVDAGSQAFLREVAWREFSYHLLFHFPAFPDVPFRPEFEAFPWQDAPEHLLAWQRGETGYPIVDAGMRQLWHTGWMHNRVRMIVASFLVKHLLIDWREGEAWFWDTLVDADLASNSASWQWVAGSGADAAPYFRIFNPILQGEKFDADGDYVRRWVPELKDLPKKWIHKPWLAPEPILIEAHIRLGKTYPHPIVDHIWARERALAAFKALPRSCGAASPGL